MPKQTTLFHRPDDFEWAWPNASVDGHVYLRTPDLTVLKPKADPPGVPTEYSLTATPVDHRSPALRAEGLPWGVRLGGLVVGVWYSAVLQGRNGAGLALVGSLTRYVMYDPQPPPAAAVYLLAGGAGPEALATSPGVFEAGPLPGAGAGAGTGGLWLWWLLDYVSPVTTLRLQVYNTTEAGDLETLFLSEELQWPGFGPAGGLPLSALRPGAAMPSEDGALPPGLFQAQLVVVAASGAERVARSQTLDSSAPEISGLRYGVGSVEEAVLMFEVDDPESDVRDCDAALGTYPGGSDVVGWTAVPLESRMPERPGFAANVVLRARLAASQAYYGVVRCTNTAGGVTGFAPLATPLPIDDFRLGACAAEVVDVEPATGRVTARWACAEATGVVAAYRVGVGTAPETADVLEWRTVGPAVTNVTLAVRPGAGGAGDAGAQYYATVQAVGRHGLTVAAAQPFVARDTFAPGSVAFADQECGAALFAVAPGAAPAPVVQWRGLTGVSHQVSGYQYSLDGVAWRDVAAGQTAVAVPVPALVPALPYNASAALTLRVRATGPHGGRSPELRCGLVLDGTPPVPAPLYLGDLPADDDYARTTGCEGKREWLERQPSFWTSAAGHHHFEGNASDTWGPALSLHEFADCEGGVVAYAVAVGTAPYGADLLPFEGMLPPLRRYPLPRTPPPAWGPVYVTVRGATAAGLSSLSTLRVRDATAPVAGAVAAPRFAGGHVNVSVSGFADPHSGLAMWECCLQGLPGEAQAADACVLAAADAAQPFSVAVPVPAAWPSGRTAYVRARAQNGVGQWSRHVAAPEPVVIERSGPLVGRAWVSVAAPGPASNESVLYTGVAAVTVHWEAVVDAQTGVAALAVGLGPTLEAVGGWTPVPATAAGSAVLALPNGTGVRAALAATNAAGVTTTHLIRTRVAFDTSPPRPTGNVTLGVGLDPAPALPLSVAATAPDLSVVWEPFTDPQSDVAGYEVSIGTAPGADDVVPRFDWRVWRAGPTAVLVPVNLSGVADGGAVYAAVVARNGVGLTAGVHGALPVERRPPVLGPVSVAALPGEAWVIALPDYDTAACAGTPSPRVVLEYTLLPAGVPAPADTPAAWTAGHVCIAGAAPGGRGVAFNVTGLQLSRGVAYVAHVRATTAAGLQSTASVAAKAPLRAGASGHVLVRSGRRGAARRWVSNGTCLEYELRQFADPSADLVPWVRTTVGTRPGAADLWAPVEADVNLSDTALGLAQEICNDTAPANATLPQGEDVHLCVEVASTTGHRTQRCAAPFRADFTAPVVYSVLQPGDNADAPAERQPWRTALALTYDADRTFEEVSGPVTFEVAIFNASGLMRDYAVVDPADIVVPDLPLLEGHFYSAAMRV